jgi:hypothetical protein
MKVRATAGSAVGAWFAQERGGMSNKYSFVLLLAAILLLSSTHEAEAAVAEWKAFDEKVSSAEDILLVTVAGSESRIDPDGQWIRTWTTFRIAESFKGGAAGTITIVTPGGSVDGLHQETVGVPSFRPGEERIVFVSTSDEGFTPLFQEQGVYEVERDGARRALVRPAPSDLILYDDQTGSVVPAEATRSLEEFRSEVRGSIRSEQERIARASAVEHAPERTPDAREFLRRNGWILALLALGLLIALIPLVRKP